MNHLALKMPQRAHRVPEKHGRTGPPFPTAALCSATASCTLAALSCWGLGGPPGPGQRLRGKQTRKWGGTATGPPPQSGWRPAWPGTPRPSPGSPPGTGPAGPGGRGATPVDCRGRVRPQKCEWIGVVVLRWGGEDNLFEKKRCGAEPQKLYVVGDGAEFSFNSAFFFEEMKILIQNHYRLRKKKISKYPKITIIFHRDF